jgi:flagellar biosynthetic protein FliP
MAFDMTLGMGLWMWLRASSGRGIAEMSAAVLAPFLVLLVPYLAGMMSGHEPMGAHVAMPITMLAAMLVRRDEYSHTHGWRRRRRRDCHADSLVA